MKVKVFARCLGLFFPAFIQYGFAEVTVDPDIPTRHPRYQVIYTINDDGSYIENRSWETTILKEQALTQAKQLSVSYSTSIQRAEVKEAYTRKADGRHISVPKSNYQVHESRGANQGAPVFSDITTLTVVFPDVAVGDTVVFAYQLTALEPMFPQHFSTFERLTPSLAIDSARIKIDYPSSLKVQYQARQLTEVQSVEKAGRKTLEWTYRNPHPAKIKRTDYSVYDLEQDPGIAFSTFKNYQDISAAYGARANPKAVVNARIQKLANEITLNQSAPRAMAHSLYDWVATNITYAGNCIGLGAVVPHDTDFILDNRMGDCKDHATLLQALLSAKGIASTQALVNAGNVYKLPKIPVVSTVNHVINYIPALDLYVDSTSASTPFGLLPFSDADKPILLVDNHRDGLKTPPTPTGANQQFMKTTVRIKPDGSASGEAVVELKGMFAVNSRASFRNVSKDAEADLVKNMFMSNGFIGSGTFVKEDPKALKDTYEFSAAFDIKDLIVVPGPGAFAIQPMIYNEAPISNYVAAAVQDDATSAEATCFSGRSTEEYVYHFPENIKILAAPDNVALESGPLSYRATYKLKGNTLSVNRVYDDRTSGNVCSAETFALYKKFAQKVRPNFRAQIVYK